MFDNLYFLGTRFANAFAVVTGDGIILIDSLNSGEEVVAQLKELGLRAEEVKYVLVTQAQPDHFGGARYLQDRFNARVVMSDADWNSLPMVTDIADHLYLRRRALPHRDLAAGRTLELGGERIEIIPTPGHTPGTESMLIPVRDGAAAHIAVLVSGLYFSTRPYGSAEFVSQIELTMTSRQHLERVVGRSNPDILLANHPASWDGVRLMARLKSRPDLKNPLIVGMEFIRRYLTVFDECAKADLARIRSQSAGGRPPNSKAPS